MVTLPRKLLDMVKVSRKVDMQDEDRQALLSDQPRSSSSSSPTSIRDFREDNPDQATFEQATFEQATLEQAVHDPITHESNFLETTVEEQVIHEPTEFEESVLEEDVLEQGVESSILKTTVFEQAVVGQTDLGRTILETTSLEMTSLEQFPLAPATPIKPVLEQGPLIPTILEPIFEDEELVIEPVIARKHLQNAFKKTALTRVALTRLALEQAMSPTFNIFPNLVPELQSLVWSHALRETRDSVIRWQPKPLDNLFRTLCQGSRTVWLLENRIEFWEISDGNTVVLFINYKNDTIHFEDRIPGFECWEFMPRRVLNLNPIQQKSGPLVAYIPTMPQIKTTWFECLYHVALDVNIVLKLNEFREYDRRTGWMMLNDWCPSLRTITANVKSDWQEEQTVYLPIPVSMLFRLPWFTIVYNEKLSPWCGFRIKMDFQRACATGILKNVELKLVDLEAERNDAIESCCGTYGTLDED